MSETQIYGILKCGFERFHDREMIGEIGTGNVLRHEKKTEKNIITEKIKKLKNKKLKNKKLKK